ncbi:Ionotropic receptor 75e [Halyomorpha halys]|nr:Ionotropic receptor 75e [Halyomorpha halys]
MSKFCLLMFIFVRYTFQNMESYKFPISRFFKNKNIGSVTLVGCSEKDLIQESLKLSTVDKGGIMIGLKGNMSSSYPTFDSQHYRTGIYFDFSCDFSKNVFKKMSSDELLNMSFAILISSDDYNETIKFLEYSTISFDSDVTLIVDNNLYDLYRTHVSKPIISNMVGMHYNATISYIKLKKRNDLKGITINSGVVWTGGFPLNITPEGIEKMLNFNYEPEEEFLSRYGFSIHKILEDAYNFRMNISIYDDWGYFNEKLKIWDTGMFHGLSAGDIDLGTSISRVYGQRLDVSLYFPPYLKFRTCFIFKHPSRLGEFTALVKPLTLGSWLCILSGVVLSGLTLWFIKWFETVDIPSNENDLASSLLSSLGTFCQQGLSSDSLRLPVRVLYIFLLVASLVIYMFYGAAVVGFLLLPSPKTIDTVEKLIDSPIIPYAENLAYHKTHFQGNFSDKAAKAYEAIKETKTEKERWIDLTAGIQKVKQGRAALYAQDTNLYRAIENSFSNSDICVLAEIEIVLIWASTVIRKKSPYKELLYQGMILTHENGLLNRVMKTWQAQRPTCFAQNESPTVSFEATVIAHMIYGLGLLLSLILLTLEIYIYKMKKNSLKNRKAKKS